MRWATDSPSPGRILLPYMGPLSKVAKVLPILYLRGLSARAASAARPHRHRSRRSISRASKGDGVADGLTSTGARRRCGVSIAPTCAAGPRRTSFVDGVREDIREECHSKGETA
jgi:hypothetical protein